MKKNKNTSIIYSNTGVDLSKILGDKPKYWGVGDKGWQ